MRTILLISIVVFFIMGCSSKIKRLELKPYTQLSIPSISVNTPSSFPKDRWITYGDTLYDSGNVIQLFRHLPNMMSEDVKIMVRVPPENQNIDFLLDKKRSDDLERTRALPPTEWERKNLAERGVTYNKHYVDYISGLKCTTNVESSNIALGVGSKRYYTVCGYYDVYGAKKRIDIFYSYTYTHRGIKYDGDTQSSSVSPEAMQLQFKKDMKAIFDSLVIHDMDRERMSKEGLLHDKKYDINSEFR